MARRRYSRNTRSRKRYNRTYRRKWRRPARYNKRGQKVYLFKRFTSELNGTGGIIINNINPTVGTFTFRLSDLPNYTEYTSLYDMYKINAVKITFVPQMTQNISLSTVNNPSAYAKFLTAIDYNDSSPVPLDDLRQYQSCKWTTILRPHKRFLRPRIVDRGATYTPGRPWISCDAPSQEHFCLKYAIDPMDSTVSNTMTYTLEAKYYLSFKNVK